MNTKLPPISIGTLIICFVMVLIVFAVLALEQDRLNARIRELEIRAGMPDPWKD